MKTKIITRYIILLICSFFSLSLSAQSDQTTDQTEISPSSDRIYIRIEIKGLACPYCAYGMEKELKEISGVEKVDIELKTGLAYISTPTEMKPSAEDLEKIIVNAGFSVGKIDYQDIPFGE